MHAIFKNNVPVIFDAILPSAIDWFEEASRLVQTQEKAEAIITARNSYRNEHATTVTELAIERVQQLFSNIQAGFFTLGFYLEKHEITAGGRNLIPDRRRRMRAFYRAFTFAVLVEHPDSVRLLESWEVNGFPYIWLAMALMGRDPGPLTRAHTHDQGIYTMQNGRCRSQALGKVSIANWGLAYRKLGCLKRELSFRHALIHDGYGRIIGNYGGLTQMADVMPLLSDEMRMLLQEGLGKQSEEAL